MLIFGCTQSDARRGRGVRATSSQSSLTLFEKPVPTLSPGHKFWTKKENNQTLTKLRSQSIWLNQTSSQSTLTGQSDSPSTLTRYWDWVGLGKTFEFSDIQVCKGLLVPDGRPTERRCVLIRLKSMIQMISCSSSRSRLYFNSTFGT